LRHPNETQNRWRGDWLAQMLAQKAHQPSRSREIRDIPVQVQPVHALHLQGHMSVQDLRYVCHDGILTQIPVTGSSDRPCRFEAGGFARAEAGELGGYFLKRY
jgi:hypothetical protein